MQDTRKEQLLKFCQSLGIEMHKLELLNSALTHTSYAHESKELPRPEHNERVEFLGDSVLSVIVSTYMYCTFPNLNEGELTKLRAHIVCEASLAAYADGLLQKMDDFEERALRNMTDAQRNALLEGGFAWMKALRDAIDD